MTLRTGDRIGDYEVIEELGAGGAATVYKVRNSISREVQVMKMLQPELASEAGFSERLLPELQVLATLDHPAIARFYTALRIQNQWAIIVELVEGATLEVLLKQGRIPPADGLDYVCQALSALSYAHRKGIIHRDLKPANMMRTPQGAIKLLDFGIAKTLTGGRHGRTGELTGSLDYVSPEQAMGASLDARSDLYSLGVCLYEIAAGVRPFHAESTLTEFKIRKDPPSPVEVDPSVPKALNAIILKALQKNPAKRFQTAEEFLAALARLISAERALPSSAGSEAPREEFRGPDGSAPLQAQSPPDRAAPSPRTDLATSPPPLKRRAGLYMTLAALLTTTLAGFVMYRILKPLQIAKQKPVSKPVEKSTPPVPRPLPPSLSLPSGDMVLVPGGRALLGQDRHPVFVAPFYIDRTVVTEGAYRAFCQETGHPLPAKSQKATDDLPVVNVTIDDALQFAKWANKRLPSAVEWEKAARGTDGRTYPWGNDLNFDLVNIPLDKAAKKSAKLAPASAYPSGASPYGALNMLGNVGQWVDAKVTVDLQEAKPHFTFLRPPLSSDDQFYEVRGGSYRNVPSDPSSLIWDFAPTPARERQRGVGFRCARDANR